MFLFFCQTEARHVLKMFLIFEKFEPQRSYKHGSYSRKSVYYSYVDALFCTSRECLEECVYKCKTFRVNDGRDNPRKMNFTLGTFGRLKHIHFP